MEAPLGRPLKKLGNFLAELKRRKVYQVTVVYLVLAVGGMELLDVLIPATELPDWAASFFLGLAIVSLPAVIVLAWTFDITPGGISRTGEQDAREDALAAAAALPSDAGADHGDAEPVGMSSQADGLDVNTIAVLPFENLSDARAAEPFVAGLHDDLLTELSRAAVLTVISRTSVSAYRGTKKTLRQIATELGAGTIVEGGVQQAGTRIRLNVQLIDARNDLHRWAERYDRELTVDNIFELQSELTTRIMTELKAQFTGEEKSRASRQHTHDLEAYRLYSIGRAEFVNRTEPGLRSAVSAFQRAIDRDPDHAAAWAGLGMALGALVDYGHADDPELMERGHQANRRALELDPHLAEGHAAEATRLIYLRDAAGARRALAQAAALGPGLALAHQWTAWLELLVGNPARAEEAAARATRLDPLDPEAWGNLAMAQLAVGRPQDALASARRCLEHAPDVDYLLWVEGLALHHLGSEEETERVYQRLTDRWSQAWPDVMQGLAAARRGDGRKARQYLARLEAAGAHCKAAIVQAALGELDAAFRSLDEMGEPFWDEALFLRYHRAPPMDAVRADPRYGDLIVRMNHSWGLAPREA